MSHTYEYPRPALTVDAIVVHQKQSGGYKILLIERLHDPFKGCKALPGGFVNSGESTEEAVCRELREETTLDFKLEQFKEVGVFSKPGRDPRGWVVSVAYLAEVEEEFAVEGCDDAASAKWYELPRCSFSLDQLAYDLLEMNLAFDHRMIILKAFEVMLRG